MENTELIQQLTEFGWGTHHDDIGDEYPCLNIHGLIVVVSFFIERHIGYEYLSFRASISTKAICSAATYIHKPDNKVAEFYAIDTMDEINSPHRSVILRSDLLNCADLIFRWANQVDIGSAIHKYASIETSSLGSAPLIHLAALAQSGDVETLTYYIKSFQCGVRLGFVPYITIQHIERALAFARKRQADSEWLPESPLIRF